MESAASLDYKKNLTEQKKTPRQEHFVNKKGRDASPTPFSANIWAEPHKDRHMKQVRAKRPAWEMLEGVAHGLRLDCCP